MDTPSISRRTEYLYLIKPRSPYPAGITANPYPILTLLNPNPRVTLGGNLNLVIEEPGQVLGLKLYNIQYHLLRAANAQSLTSAVTSHQGVRAFEHLNSILVAMEEYPHLVGGLRMELRVMIRFNHYIDDAVNHIIDREPSLPSWQLQRYSARIYHACKTTVLHRQGHSCWQWYHAPLC
jgi:hypothetical protein